MHGRNPTTIYKHRLTKFFTKFQESTSKSQMTSLRRNVDSWLKEHNIRAFFSVTQDESFSVGAKSCMNLVGLGMKISHPI